MEVVSLTPRSGGGAPGIHLIGAWVGLKSRLYPVTENSFSPAENGAPIPRSRSP
jgi:hypothetical protein